MTCRQKWQGRLANNLKLHLCNASRNAEMKRLLYYQSWGSALLAPVKQTREILSASQPCHFCEAGMQEGLL